MGTYISNTGAVERTGTGPTLGPFPFTFPSLPVPVGYTAGDLIVLVTNMIFSYTPQQLTDVAPHPLLGPEWNLEFTIIDGGHTTTFAHAGMAVYVHTKISNGTEFPLTFPWDGSGTLANTNHHFRAFAMVFRGSKQNLGANRSDGWYQYTYPTYPTSAPENVTATSAGIPISFSSVAGTGIISPSVANGFTPMAVANGSTAIPVVPVAIHTPVAATTGVDYPQWPLYNTYGCIAHFIIYDTPAPRAGYSKLRGQQRDDAVPRVGNGGGQISSAAGLGLRGGAVYW